MRDCDLVAGSVASMAGRRVGWRVVSMAASLAVT